MYAENCLICSFDVIFDGTLVGPIYHLFYEEDRINIEMFLNLDDT